MSLQSRLAALILAIGADIKALRSPAWSWVTGKPSITAGNGLTGGGSLDTSKTITLGSPSDITADSANTVTSTSHSHRLILSLGNDSLTGDEAPDTYPNNTVTVTRRGSASGTSWPGYGVALTAATYSNRYGQLFFTGGADGDLLFRNGGTGWSPWRKVWHDGIFDPSNYTLTSRSISAGNGLSGGGNLTANRTISLGTPGTLSGSTTNAVQSTSHTHALSANLSAWDSYHPDDAWVDKGTIPGSQDLNNYTTTGVYHQNQNADATSGTNYPANVAGMLVVYANSAMVYQSYQRYNTGDVWTRSCYSGSWSAWKLSVDGTTTISAGNGLSGGGSLAANRTISLGTPGTITGTSTNSVSASSHTHALSANLKAWDGVTVASKANDNEVVKTFGNQSGLSGNKTWTGTHTFSTASGIADIYLRSGSTDVGGVFSDSDRTVVWTNAGHVGLRPNGRGSATGQFTVNANGSVETGGSMSVAGSFTATGYVRANSGRFYGNTTAGGDTHILSGDGNTTGHITIRPRGWSTVNQTVFRNDGSVYFSGELSVNGLRIPKIFVQSGDPGSSASTGDLWVW